MTVVASNELGNTTSDIFKMDVMEIGKLFFPKKKDFSEMNESNLRREIQIMFWFLFTDTDGTLFLISAQRN